MNRRLSLILATVLPLLVVAGLATWWFVPRTPPVYKPVGPGEVYLALGDSLAWGFRLAHPETESYPSLLQSRLNTLAPGGKLVNLSVPGETSTSLQGQQLQKALALIKRERAAGHRVSPITIDIGGNDLLRVENSTEAQRAAALAKTRSNIAATLDALREATEGSADIAIMSYYNPYGGDPAVANSEAAWVMQLNSAISTEATRRGVTVADAYTPFTGGRTYAYTNILTNDIHANREGHAVIAQQFWAALGYMT